MQLSHTLLVSTLMIAGLPYCATAWEVDQMWEDPISGNSYRVARETNDDGFSIFIFRDLDGRVRAVYSLPVSTFDRLPLEGRVLAIRPDEHEPRTIKAEIVPGKYVQGARSDGRHIRDTLWHGEDPSPTRGTLRQILDSETVFARFYTDTGGIIDTSWDMDGGAVSIAEAIDIGLIAAPAEVEWANLQTDLILTSSKRCGTNVDCKIEVAKCMSLITDGSRDVDGFDRCVELAFPTP